jgi:hypothetical protein
MSHIVALLDLLLYLYACPTHIRQMGRPVGIDHCTVFSFLQHHKPQLA